jgi:hypothetical protein
LDNLDGFITLITLINGNERIRNMKIGILSMQRVVNYGSFLQGFALKETLRNQGHECFFIDIKPGRKIIEVNSPVKRESKLSFILKRLDKYFIRRVGHHYFMKKRIERFYNEFFPILGVTREPDYNSNYDAVVIGSDEVTIMWANELFDPEKPDTYYLEV